MKLSNVFRKAFRTPVKVRWDDTNLNFTKDGPRRSGSFMSSNFLKAYFWALRWTIANPRAFVHIEPIRMG